MPRVGMLMPGPAAHSAAILDPFYRGLHELGYVERRNIAIERRDGDWKPDRLPALAAELVGLKGGSPSACSCSETLFPGSLVWLPSGTPMRTANARWRAL
jgi:hypothetical protein